MQVKDRINSFLDKEGGAVTDRTIEEIKKILRVSSQWDQAKLAGTDAVFSGEPRAALNELLRQLRGIGIFVVECGEIERFAPSIGGHGPKWVMEVMKRELGSDEELEDARKFVKEMLNTSASYVYPAQIQNEAGDNAIQSVVEKSQGKSRGTVWFHLREALRLLFFGSSSS
jgi:hypothetical protein